MNSGIPTPHVSQGPGTDFIKTYGSLHDFGYKDFLSHDEREKFDADEWAELVKRSGARYAGPVFRACG